MVKTLLAYYQVDNYEVHNNKQLCAENKSALSIDSLRWGNEICWTGGYEFATGTSKMESTGKNDLKFYVDSGLDGGQ